jgi:hypothetical protein
MIYLFQYDFKFITHEFNNIARNDFLTFSGFNHPIYPHLTIINNGFGFGFATT